MSLPEIIAALSKAGFSRKQMNGQGFIVEADRTDPTRFLLGAKSRTQIFTSDPKKAAEMRQHQINRRIRILSEMAEALKLAGAAVEVVLNGRKEPFQIIITPK